MLKRLSFYFSGLCVALLGVAPLSGCEKQEEHPAAPEAAPAQAPAPTPPPAPAVDPKAEAAAKAAEMQKQAKEARDKAQAELNEQVDAVGTKLGELKAKAVGHKKVANTKMKKAMIAAEAQLKQLREDAKLLGEVGEDKFAEGKERLQKALATATKGLEQLTAGGDKKHK